MAERNEGARERSRFVELALVALVGVASLVSLVRKDGGSGEGGGHGSPGGSGSGSGRRHLSGRDYLLTFLALLFLATLSFLLSFLRWKTGDLVISLVIATAKALLVLFFFMHLVEQRFANRVVVLVSVMLMALLLALTAADVATRDTAQVRPLPSAGNGFYRR
jgi:cytochrome c oxidase subunit 4